MGESRVEAPPGMLHVPAGPFVFGRRERRELPDFWIDAYPVTNRDYLLFVQDTGHRPPGGWPADGPTEDQLDLPVVYVTFADAVAYAEALGKRLPTPAEFEKAARGPDGRKYPWGDQVGVRTTNTRESAIGRLVSVGSYEEGRSPYGCYDMAGNVLHWTRGAPAGSVQHRVLKGASFGHYLGSAAWSHQAPADAREPWLGFRCVWSPQET